MAAFPLPLIAKARLAGFMLRTFLKGDWSDWHGRSAAALVDRWAGRTVRHALFEPLCRLKFDLPATDVSAAWLGARLHAREGSSPLGYIPDGNWTKVLCDGVTRLCTRAGVEIRLGTAAVRLEGEHGTLHRVVTDTGEPLAGDTFVSTVPPPVYRRMVGSDETPELPAIRYTALLSVVCAVPLAALPRFYWLNLSSLASTACAIFRLDALNPTIGDPREMCLNFVTHLPGRDHPLFALRDEDLLARYAADFRRLFGIELSPTWVHVARVPMYSPVFHQSYANPPLRSATWRNLFFAGNYRTFPSVASTGTALASGLKAAAGVLRQADAERERVRSAA